MADTLEIIINPELVATELELLRNGEVATPLLCQLGGGVLHFAEVAFPDVGSRELYAQVYERQARGRGAHFDVYGEYLDAAHPYIGHFNLTGRAALLSVGLPAELADNYFSTFSVADEAAYEARRHYAAIALSAPGAEVMTATIEPGTGMILAQRVEGPHVVHDIVPIDKSNPGEFVKLVVPGAGHKLDRILQDGYLPLDTVVSDLLAGTGHELGRGYDESEEELDDEPLEVADSMRHFRPPPAFHRSCNLD